MLSTTTLTLNIYALPQNPLAKKKTDYLIPNLHQIITEKLDKSGLKTTPTFFYLCTNQKKLIDELEDAITLSIYNPKTQRLIIFIGENYVLKISSLNQFLYDNWHIYDNSETFKMLADNYSENFGIFLYWSAAFQKILNNIDTSELIEVFEKLVIIYRKIKANFPHIINNKVLFEKLQQSFVVGVDLVTNHKRGIWTPDMLRDFTKQLTSFTSNLINFVLFHLSEEVNKIALNGFNIINQKNILEKMEEVECDFDDNLEERSHSTALLKN